MKKVTAVILCLFMAILTAQSSNADRKTVNINREWKYMQGDIAGAEKTRFNDNNWESIGLPHSFSIPYFMSKDFYVGYGWYRRILKIPSSDIGKNISLEFDGVFQQAELFVNGAKAGSHIGGYTGFSIDISSLVRPGDNTIAVRVNNLWKANVAPRAGEHVFSGGIYRNVRMVVKAPIHISWYGTFVTTPDLAKTDGKSTSVNVETEICNSSNIETEFTLLTEILSPSGKKVASKSSKEMLGKNEVKKIVHSTKQINNINLWTPSSPIIYKVLSKLYKGGKLIDQQSTDFGFRWFEWTKDRGFFLNGEHFDILGANVHQDQAGWGDAITESAMRRDVEMMKEAGFNFIRGSHYPHAPAFSSACDNTGMLLWSETPFWGIGGFKEDGYWDSSAYPVNKMDEEDFERSALQQLNEMIRIHRNHPSIVVWSMGNEAFFSAANSMSGVRRLLKNMVELTHELDPTRPAAVGGAQRPLGGERIDLIGDVAGYNGDGATQPDFQNPSVPNIVSEYGSTTSERPGKYEPGWGDLKKNDGWKGRTWRSGKVIWCGFDHGSIAGSALGKMGIVDYFRIPKRSWYWYRNEYTNVAPPTWAQEGIPYSVDMSASKTKDIKADGTDDVMINVNIMDNRGRRLSNSPSVKLEVISGPGEFPTGRSIIFENNSDINIADGEAAITLRSYYAGEAVVVATSLNLVSDTIRVNFVGATQYKHGVTLISERPYIKFERESKNVTSQIFGLNNPTFASSNKAGYAAGLATDGKTSTCWKAASTDNNPWWMLDTEKRLNVESIKIILSENISSDYTIEFSDDNERWRPVVYKRGDVKNNILEKTFTKADNVTGRFLRLMFNDASKASIAEVVVIGRVCE